MINKKEYPIKELKKTISLEKKILESIKRFYEEFQNPAYDESEKRIIKNKIEELKEELKKLNNEFGEVINELTFSKEDGIGKGVSLKNSEIESRYFPAEGNKLKNKGGRVYSKKELYAEGLEIETIKRLRESRKKVKKIINKDLVKERWYLEVSSKVFSKFSKSLLGNESFKKLEKDLIKANIDYAPTGYISMIFFTTLLAGIAGGFIFLFFLFFNIQANVPFIIRASETINERLLETFWILFVVPIGTFLMMFFYPTLEKKTAEFKIESELPFGTMHMAAIAGSLINPSKIFEIMISTNEYPALTKEFTNLLNEINIYGSDLVSALKNTARNTSSKRLTELLNGIATTINSGGELPDFFEKRSESLLFEYRIHREKAAKAAETMMDLYISLVIASPMILMLLLMMMKLSGIGLSASVGTITMIMILGVVAVNIVFLTLLHLKKQQ